MAIIANSDTMKESLSLPYKTHENQSVREQLNQMEWYGISHYEELYLLLFQVVTSYRDLESSPSEKDSLA